MHTIIVNKAEKVRENESCKDEILKLIINLNLERIKTTKTGSKAIATLIFKDFIVIRTFLEITFKNFRKSSFCRNEKS